MQYQHLVFEDFARSIQPNIDEFEAHDVTINPNIVAEFAHAVYRFGHSMLRETVDRIDANGNMVVADAANGDQQLALIDAFLNPLAYADRGAGGEAAAEIVRGATREVANGVDEFVTGALRNNLLGLPLDLASINLARGRDAGVAPLNSVRDQFYQATGDADLKPYESWMEFGGKIKHPESSSTSSRRTAYTRCSPPRPPSQRSVPPPLRWSMAQRMIRRLRQMRASARTLIF